MKIEFAKSVVEPGKFYLSVGSKYATQLAYLSTADAKKLFKCMKEAGF